jgi:hypothetical protein
MIDYIPSFLISHLTSSVNPFYRRPGGFKSSIHRTKKHDNVFKKPSNSPV